MVDCCLTWSLALIDLRVSRTRRDQHDHDEKGSLGSAEQGNQAAPAAVWNSLNPINVKADTASTYADVDVSDYTSSSDSRAGWFDCSAGADDIKLNTHWMDGYNDSQKHAVVTHEFGHSLKLAHGPEIAVMDTCPACYNPNMNNNLQSWDINSYPNVWGY
ncbi:zinc metalloprotease [Micromonospora musae]|uniref:hypothetical protein n=1 Tax=Micromonospora musae TaxID=1894970 RepID=UPI001F38A476|nr:hypothetical protein [Micromonospora musae]